MNRTELLDALNRYYDSEELKDLCFSLYIDYAALPGRTKQAKAREIIEACERSSRLVELEREIIKKIPAAQPLPQAPHPAGPAPAPKKKLPTEVLVAIIAGVFTVLAATLTILLPRLLPDSPLATLPVAVTFAAVTTSPSPQPTVFVVSQLPEAFQRTANQAASGLYAMGQQQPLVIKDKLDNNDYGWIESPETDYGVVSCAFQVSEGGYHLELKTDSSPGYCQSNAPPTALDFFLRTILSTQGKPNSEVVIFFRSSDEKNYSYLGFNPTTQQFYLRRSLDGSDEILVPYTFEPEIHKTGPNEVGLIAYGNQIAVYFNQSLAALLTDPAPPLSGSIILRLFSNEANTSDELVVDEFELRGN